MSNRRPTFARPSAADVFAANAVSAAAWTRATRSDNAHRDADFEAYRVASLAARATSRAYSAR